MRDHGLDHPVLTLLNSRFDRVDRDNKAIVEQVDEIKLKVDAIQAKVDRHAVYWDVTKWAAPTVMGSILAWLGFKQSH